MTAYLTLSGSLRQTSRSLISRPFMRWALTSLHPFRFAVFSSHLSGSHISFSAKSSSLSLSHRHAGRLFSHSFHQQPVFRSVLQAKCLNSLFHHVYSLHSLTTCYCFRVIHSSPVLQRHRRSFIAFPGWHHVLRFSVHHHPNHLSLRFLQRYSRPLVSVIFLDRSFLVAPFDLPCFDLSSVTVLETQFQTFIQRQSLIRPPSASHSLTPYFNLHLTDSVTPSETLSDPLFPIFHFAALYYPLTGLIFQPLFSSLTWET